MNSNENAAVKGMRYNINGTNLPKKLNNPLKKDAFLIDDETKIKLIAEKFKDIIDVLGLDLTDDSIKNTPLRIAKMYVNEVFKGLNPRNKPKITVFKNTYGYHNPLIELNIHFTSFCEHHFVPIQGKANIAYIPNENVIGLSKIHRIVDYYACRPQVQERLCLQILQELSSCLKTDSVGVVLKANHSCISCRGVEDLGSATLTSAFTGSFETDENLKSVLFGN